MTAFIICAVIAEQGFPSTVFWDGSDWNYERRFAELFDDADEAEAIASSLKGGVAGVRAAFVAVVQPQVASAS